jgi:hypothetical protein
MTAFYKRVRNTTLKRKMDRMGYTKKKGSPLHSYNPETMNCSGSFQYGSAP